MHEIDAVSYTHLDVYKRQLLDRFAVKLEDVPIVICHTGGALRNPCLLYTSRCV